MKVCITGAARPFLLVLGEPRPRLDINVSLTWTRQRTVWIAIALQG